MPRRRLTPTLAGMDRSSAIWQLPDLHAAAIRLRDDGFGDHVIAVALGIDDHQVATLLQIANSKLTNLMALDGI
jgi:hypothetical protein